MVSYWSERLRDAIKWLYPGLGVKRWLLLAVFGLLILLSGIFLFWTHGFIKEGSARNFLELLGGLSFHPLILIVIVIAGLFILFWGLQQTGNAIAGNLLPHHGRRIIEKLYSKRYLEKGPKIVSIGGGTGLSVLLRGLKEYTSNITAVVTVTDDGGSSGRLRGEIGMLPPGDLRNCILALADTEPLLEELFQHRFQGGNDLEGHSFGNLFIAAMTEMMGFEQAIKEFSKVLAIRGTVLPVTLENIILKAVFTDGTEMEGETRIVKEGKTIDRLLLSPSSCKPLPEVISAIKEADAIILGPGSLYTSVLPNLLVPGVKEAIKESAALCIYVCNIMTQPGETQGFTVSRHLEVFRRHGCEDIIDTVVVNNDTDIFSGVAENYILEGAEPVEFDRGALSKWDINIIQAPLLEREGIHHDSRKLATLIIDKLIERETGLEGFWAYTFLSLNGNFRRVKKEMHNIFTNPYIKKQKKLQRYFNSIFRSR